MLTGTQIRLQGIIAPPHFGSHEPIYGCILKLISVLPYLRRELFLRYLVWLSIVAIVKHKTKSKKEPRFIFAKEEN